MKLEHFHPLEDLLYYDGPLLTVYKQITRITLSTKGFPESREGDMFDGTVEHWRDYFSNFFVAVAREFAESEGVEIKFYGQDWLVAWNDVDETVTPPRYLWWAYPITAENLERLTAKPSSGKAMTLLAAMQTAPVILSLDDHALFTEDGTVEGMEIRFADLQADALPTSDSYVAFEEQTVAPNNLIEPSEPASPGVLAAAPDPSTLDWPDLDTVPSQLMDGDDCPWKQSNFL